MIRKAGTWSERMDMICCADDCIYWTQGTCSIDPEDGPQGCRSYRRRQKHAWCWAGLTRDGGVRYGMVRTCTAAEALAEIRRTQGVLERLQVRGGDAPFTADL